MSVLYLTGLFNPKESIMLMFIGNHWLVWLGMFFIAIIILSVCGCNPLTTADRKGAPVVKENPLLWIPLVGAVVGEYTFIAALIINGIALFR